MLHVVSTGFSAPTRERCLLSVEAQVVNFQYQHHYVEASTQVPPRDVITNMASVIIGLPADAIVVLLDGDDWLVDDCALVTVNEMHAAGAWVTWGSFEFSDGRPGFAADVDRTRPIRTQPWVTTHLKTIRAGLFHRLTDEDLRWPAGLAVPWDMLIMFAAIEMAGYDRCTYCPKVLSAYHFPSSYEFQHGAGAERVVEALIRSRAVYGRVEEL